MTIMVYNVVVNTESVNTGLVNTKSMNTQLVSAEPWLLEERQGHVPGCLWS